jgi:hypothetical protein
VVCEKDASVAVGEREEKISAARAQAAERLRDAQRLREALPGLTERRDTYMAKVAERDALVKDKEVRRCACMHLCTHVYVHVRIYIYTYIYASFITSSLHHCTEGLHCSLYIIYIIYIIYIMYTYYHM